MAYTEISGVKIDLLVDYDGMLGFVSGRYASEFRASIKSPLPGLLMARCGSVFQVSWPKQTSVISCDLYTVFIFPKNFVFNIKAISSLSEFSIFFLSEQLITDTAKDHEIDSQKINKMFSEPMSLRRTNWFNEVLHRFIFERVSLGRKESEAACFLQREIVKEAFYRATEISIAMNTHLDLDEKGFTKRNNSLKKALSFIEAHLFQPFTIAELARASGASTSTLLRIFESEFDKSPRKYLLERRLEESCQLIKSGRYSIGEVGFMIGYESPSAFSRAFKEKFGKTPTEIETSSIKLPRTAF